MEIEGADNQDWTRGTAADGMSLWCLNENDHHRLIDLSAWSPGVALFGRLRRCGLVGGSLSLGAGFEVSKSLFQTQSLPQTAVCGSGCKLPATSPALCLPASMLSAMLPAMMITD